MTEVVLKRTSALYGPVLSLLKKEGYTAADMHFHTEFSMDGISKITNVLKHCRKFGYGVAITDHNEIGGAIKAYRLKKKEFIIPGIELSCHRGIHTLLYFYSINELKDFYRKEILPIKKKNPFFLPIKTEELIDKARSYNCVICAPHPYGPGIIGIKKVPIENEKKILKYIHCIEGINGACLRNMNLKAIKWAKKINKPMTAGTDGHTIHELGRSLCCSKGDTVEDFLNNIKEGDNLIIGEEVKIFEELLNQASKFTTEERREKGKLLKLYEERYRTEHDFLLYKIKNEEHFLMHHLLHHKHPKKEHKELAKKHKHFRHLFS